MTVHEKVPRETVRGKGEEEGRRDECRVTEGPVIAGRQVFTCICISPM